MKDKGTLLVISGASGVGKSTVISEVMAARSDLYFSVSFTTRTARPGEVNGKNYNFVDRAAFEAMIADDEFFEYAEYIGNYYGTSKKLIFEKLEQGISVLLDIEVQGAANVKARAPEAVLAFLIPPSFDELARRLRARNTDSEEKIQDRLTRAREEYAEIPKYDYIVVNDTVASAANEVLSILTAETCRMKNRLHLTEGV
ncbi:MAG: guanylate kinase [Evtepia sp.]